jgi:hypothetical protein
MVPFEYLQKNAVFARRTPCLDVSIASSEIALEQKSLKLQVFEIGDLTIALEQKGFELQVLEIMNRQLQEKLQRICITLEQMSGPSDYPKLSADTSDKRVVHLARLDDCVERATQFA